MSSSLTIFKSFSVCSALKYKVGTSFEKKTTLKLTKYFHQNISHLICDQNIFQDEIGRSLNELCLIATCFNQECKSSSFQICLTFPVSSGAIDPDLITLCRVTDFLNNKIIFPPNQLKGWLNSRSLFYV